MPRLTDDVLKKIIIEEKLKFKRSKKLKETLEQKKCEPNKIRAQEVDADEFAGTLENQIDFIKALKIEENKLVKKLNNLRQIKEEALERASNKIK